MRAAVSSRVLAADEGREERPEPDSLLSAATAMAARKAAHAASGLMPSCARAWPSDFHTAADEPFGCRCRERCSVANASGWPCLRSRRPILASLCAICSGSVVVVVVTTVGVMGWSIVKEGEQREGDSDVEQLS